MKKYLTILLGILLLTGCNSKKELEIKLEGNPTTGYEWKCDIVDKSIVKEERAKYKPDSTELMGSGGVYTFVYTGLKEGKTKIICEYARSFEKNSTEKTKEYKIEVDKKLNIKENK